MCQTEWQHITPQNHITHDKYDHVLKQVSFGSMNLVLMYPVSFLLYYLSMNINYAYGKTL